MTSEKWNHHPAERQVFRIGSEFARAKNLLREGWDDEARRCYGWRFALLDLCAMDPQWRPRQKELLRFRKMPRELSLDVANDDPRFMMISSTLVNWTAATSAPEL